VRGAKLAKGKMANWRRVHTATLAELKGRRTYVRSKIESAQKLLANNLTAGPEYQKHIRGLINNWEKQVKRLDQRIEKGIEIVKR